MNERKRERLLAPVRQAFAAAPAASLRVTLEEVNPQILRIGGDPEPGRLFMLGITCSSDRDLFGGWWDESPATELDPWERVAVRCARGRVVRSQFSKSFTGEQAELGSFVGVFLLEGDEELGDLVRAIAKITRRPIAVPQAEPAPAVLAAAL